MYGIDSLTSYRDLQRFFATPLSAATSINREIAYKSFKKKSFISNMQPAYLLRNDTTQHDKKK